MATAKTKSKSKNQSKAQSTAPHITSSSPVSAELGKDEKLLWESRAGAGAYALAHMRAVVMGLTFVLVGMAWGAYVSHTHMMPEIGYVAWLFGAVGAYYLALPVLAYIKAKWFLFYGLSDRRLLIVQLFPKHRVTAFPIKALKRAVATGANVGNGTLLIDAPGAISKNPVKPRAGFYGVKYATKLEEAVFALQNPEAALEKAQAAAKARTQSLAKPQSVAPSGGGAPTPFTPSGSARMATQAAPTRKNF